MIMVMSCIHQGHNRISNDGVLFMDWMLLGVSWDEVLLGLFGSSRTGDTGEVDMAFD